MPTREELQVKFYDPNTDTTLILHGAINENQQRSNLMPQHNVEVDEEVGVTPVVSSFSRRLPYHGTLEVILSEDIVADAIGEDGGPDRRVTRSLKDQWADIKFLYTVRAQQRPLVLETLLDRLPNVLIEDISATRDRVQNRILVTISWRELRIARQRTSAIKLALISDLGTGLQTTGVTVAVGYVTQVRETVPTTAVEPQTEIVATYDFSAYPQQRTVGNTTMTQEEFFYYRR